MNTKVQLQNPAINTLESSSATRSGALAVRPSVDGRLIDVDMRFPGIPPVTAEEIKVIRQFADDLLIALIASRETPP